MKIMIVGVESRTATAELLTLMGIDLGIVEIVGIDQAPTPEPIGFFNIPLDEALLPFKECEEPKQKPQKGHFRRQFGGTGKRLDRRYK